MVRDLAPQIKAQAEAKVNAASLNKGAKPLPTDAALESAVVEHGAQLMANTILAERSWVRAPAHPGRWPMA